MVKKTVGEINLLEQLDVKVVLEDIYKQHIAINYGVYRVASFNSFKTYEKFVKICYSRYKAIKYILEVNKK